MTDYVVQIRIKNGPLLRAMRAAGFTSALALAKASGISAPYIGQLLNLTRPPIGKNRDDWPPSVIRLSEVLKTLPQDLFPEQHVRQALKRTTAELNMSVEDVAGLIGQQGNVLSPEDRLIEQQREDAVSQWVTRNLGTAMNERTERVLRLRFGLDGKGGRTLDQTAQEMGVTRERVRQMEARAIQRLRHPSRIKELINYYPAAEGAFKCAVRRAVHG